MKRKDVVPLVGVAIFSFVVAFIIAGMFISPPAKRTAKVPVIDNLESSFADVQNDPDYKSFLNEDALDPTQLIQIGQNPGKPFN